MKTMIFCEGTTDLLMIQYVLQYKYGWHYNGFLENAETNRLRKKTLKRDTDIVDIESCGGIMNIPKRMRDLERRYVAVLNDKRGDITNRDVMSTTVIRKNNLEEENR